MPGGGHSDVEISIGVDGVRIQPGGMPGKGNLLPGIAVVRRAVNSVVRLLEARYQKPDAGYRIFYIYREVGIIKSEIYDRLDCKK